MKSKEEEREKAIRKFQIELKDSKLSNNQKEKIKEAINDYFYMHQYLKKQYIELSDILVKRLYNYSQQLLIDKKMPVQEITEKIKVQSKEALKIITKFEKDAEYAFESQFEYISKLHTKDWIKAANEMNVALEKAEKMESTIIENIKNINKKGEPKNE